MATELESKFQEKVMALMRKRGVYVYKNAQNMYTEKGRPDLAACMPVSLKRLCEIYGEDSKVGIFVGLELKRKGKLNNVSEAQQIVGNTIRKCKGIWLAIDDIDDVKKLLDMYEVENVI